MCFAHHRCQMKFKSFKEIDFEKSKKRHALELLEASWMHAFFTLSSCQATEPVLWKILKKQWGKTASAWLDWINLCAMGRCLAWLGEGCPVLVVAHACPLGHFMSNEAPMVAGIAGRGGRGWRRSVWREISAVCLESCPGFPAKKTNKNK